jgi:hypothetical protein
MDIFYIVLNFMTSLADKGFLGMIIYLFFKIAWVFVLFLIWPYLLELFIQKKQGKFAAGVKYTYLAIDVPKENEQSPKAVEQIFNQIWGYKAGGNLWTKWLGGEFLLSFSLEIVSIDGYVQYVVRCPKHFRDLVESAFFAQYPDADIDEIEDYTKDINSDNFKEKGYDLWGSQFELTDPDAYPIKTYPYFEHSISQKIIDPMSAMLEMMSKLNKGEQLWFQIIIRAEDDNWKEESLRMIKRLVGAKETAVPKSKTMGLIEKGFGSMYDVLDKSYQTHYIKPEAKRENEAPPTMMQYMTAGEKDIVSAIEEKATKTGYKTKMRMIYMGKKGVFSKPRGVSPFVGALRQYAFVNLNGFKPVAVTKTGADYIGASKRLLKKQKTILRNYKNRSLSSGSREGGYLLNVEELASLYHFPTIEVGTRSIKTAESKKVEAPIEATLEGLFDEVVEPDEVTEEMQNEENKDEKKIDLMPPSDLPF